KSIRLQAERVLLSRPVVADRDKPHTGVPPGHQCRRLEEVREVLLGIHPPYPAYQKLVLGDAPLATQPVPPGPVELEPVQINTVVNHLEPVSRETTGDRVVAAGVAVGDDQIREPAQHPLDPGVELLDPRVPVEL